MMTSFFFSLFPRPNPHSLSFFVCLQNVFIHYYEVFVCANFKNWKRKKETALCIHRMNAKCRYCFYSQFSFFFLQPFIWTIRLLKTENNLIPIHSLIIRYLHYVKKDTENAFY